jgi:hypothetical protein
MEATQLMMQDTKAGEVLIVLSPEQAAQVSGGTQGNPKNDPPPPPPEPREGGPKVGPGIDSHSLA